MLIVGINTDCHSKTSSSVIHSIANIPVSIVHMVKSTKDVMIIAGTLSAIIIIYKAGLMTYTWDIVRSPTRIAGINKRTENIQKTQSDILKKLIEHETILKNLSTESADTNKILHDYLADFEIFKNTTNIHHDDIIRNIQAMQARLEGQNSALDLLIKQQIASILPQLLAALGAIPQASPGVVPKTVPGANSPQARRAEPSRDAA
jgi:hypothetical protein